MKPQSEFLATSIPVYDLLLQDLSQHLIWSPCQKKSVLSIRRLTTLQVQNLIQSQMKMMDHIGNMHYRLNMPSAAFTILSMPGNLWK